MTAIATQPTISLDFSDVYVKWNGSYGTDELPAGYVIEWEAADKLADASIDPNAFSGYSNYYLIIASGTEYDLFEGESFYKISLMDENGNVQILTLTEDAAMEIRVNRSRQRYGNGPSSR